MISTILTFVSLFVLIVCMFVFGAGLVSIGVGVICLIWSRFRS